jgi:hypothetical protein
VTALLGKVLPQDVSAWQLGADCTALRKQAHGLTRGLKQQKEVRQGVVTEGPSGCCWGSCFWQHATLPPSPAVQPLHSCSSRMRAHAALHTPCP